MAGLQADEAAAARVAAAKLRLRQLAQDVPRPPQLGVASASLVRAHPWRGVAIALAVGLVLGVAPRSALGRLGLVLGPVAGAVATRVTPWLTGTPATVPTIRRKRVR